MSNGYHKSSKTTNFFQNIVSRGYCARGAPFGSTRTHLAKIRDWTHRGQHQELGYFGIGEEDGERWMKRGVAPACVPSARIRVSE